MASQTSPYRNQHHINTCMVSACICVHIGFDCNCDRFVCLTVFEEDCICIRRSCCIVAAPGSVRPRGVGCVADKREGSEEICKVGLYCCDCGLIQPGCSYDRPLCSSAWKGCCCYTALAFPFHRDIVPEPVCAYYGIQCAPRCGCCAPPPKALALDRLIGLAKGHQAGAGDDVRVALVAEATAMDRGDDGYCDHPFGEVEMAAV